MLIASTGSSNPVMRERKRNSARWWSKVDETAKTEKSKQRKNKSSRNRCFPNSQLPRGLTWLLLHRIHVEKFRASSPKAAVIHRRATL